MAGNAEVLGQILGVLEEIRDKLGSRGGGSGGAGGGASGKGEVAEVVSSPGALAVMGGAANNVAGGALWAKGVAGGALGGLMSGFNTGIGGARALGRVGGYDALRTRNLGGNAEDISAAGARGFGAAAFSDSAVSALMATGSIEQRAHSSARDVTRRQVESMARVGATMTRAQIERLYGVNKQRESRVQNALSEADKAITTAGSADQAEAFTRDMAPFRLALQATVPELNRFIETLKVAVSAGGLG